MATLARRAIQIFCVWVFDLDDTLMQTAKLYIQKVVKAYYFICRHHLREHAPTLNQFQQKQREIDSDLRRRINPITKEPYYYAMERFPLSLVETYEHFCQHANLKLSHEIAEEVKKIGYEVYLTVEQYKKKFKPEAWRLLPFLRDKGDALVLLTKGDRRVQLRKLKALDELGLLKYFSAHYIVRDKNRETFRKIKRRFRKAAAYFSVGNEYPSDIEPAIKAGFFGLYVPVSEAAVWEKGKLEKIEEERNKERSNRYAKLSEIRKKHHYLVRETIS